MIRIPRPSEEVLEEYYAEISEKIKEAFKNVKSFTAKVNKKDIHVDEEVIERVKETMQEDEVLSFLLKATPEELLLLQKWIKLLCPEVLDKADACNRLLYRVFVERIYNRNEKFDKRAFIQRLDLHTCPYCNRAYTYCLDKKGKIKPQIDHFYPKSKYPFLALSFYNLIPSCQTCNGFDAKADNDPAECGLRSPYLIKDDDFTFSYTPKNSNVIAQFPDQSSLEVTITSANASNNIETFKLQELYGMHADHVQELIMKSQIQYSDEYKAYLSEYDQLGLTSDEINRLIVGNYTQPEEWHKRPLAKLYYDIAKELKLLR